MLLDQVDGVITISNILCIKVETVGDSGDDLTRDGVVINDKNA